MNGHLSFVVEDQHDDFKKVPGSVGSEHQETVGRLVVAEVVDNELMFDGVVDVAIGAAVLAGRRVDFPQSNRNTNDSLRSTARPTGTAAL